MKNFFEGNESNVRSYCRKFDAVFEKSKGATLFDTEGKKYIDFFSGAGALNFGHNHDYIKNKIVDYLLGDNVIHALDFYTKAKYDFLSNFIQNILIPRELHYKVMFPGPTGTNAVEAALKLARKVKQRENIIAFSGAFHGMTLGSLAVTTDKSSRGGAGVPLGNVTFIPFESGGGYSFNSLDYLEALLNDDHSGIDLPAAIIFETVQAEGGVNVASIEWIQRLDRLCKEHDILLICDDVQCGVGRTGTFFSFERANIKPDIVVLSKSISGYGLPMSMLLFKPELDIWKPAEHNGTFRGNQLAFVGAKAMIELWNIDSIEDQVKAKSVLITDFLNKEIQPISSQIEIRGIGMIWAIDFKFLPNIIVGELIRECFKHGLIVETCGRADSAIKLLPSLTISAMTLLEGLSILKSVISSNCNSLNNNR